MTDEAMSPLRRRMIEDMSMRRLAPKTQKDYIQVIKNLAIFIGRSPDTAEVPARDRTLDHAHSHAVRSGIGRTQISRDGSKDTTVGVHRRPDWEAAGMIYDVKRLSKWRT